MKPTLGPALILTLLLTSPAISSPPDDLEGDWAGWAYLDSGSDFPLQAHFPEGGAATWDLLPNRDHGLPLTEVRQEDGQVHFEHHGSWHLLFDGTLEGDRIEGTLQNQGSWRARFQLHRSPEPLPAIRSDAWDDVPGFYRLGDDRTLVVSQRFWGELLYTDTETGRHGTLFATSETTLFAGSAMYVPGPISARCELTRDETGALTSLTWRPALGEPIVASRVEIDEEPVSFTSGEARLSGTLLKPPGEGPHPAIVVLGGSNWDVREVNRRDAMLFASVGLAALIYDKRGSGESEGQALAAFEQTGEDAAAAVRYLESRDDVRADATGLSGRSRGGWFAPIAAARAPDAVDFVVLFVAPAISPARQETTRRLNDLSESHPDADVEEARTYLERLWELGRTGEGWEAYAEARASIERRGWLPILGGPETPDDPDWAWMRLNMHHDPVPALEKVRCPLLALYGSADRNVVPEENVPALRSALERAGNDDFTIRVLPEADHGLRLAGDTEAEWLHRKQGFAPELWPTVFGWLRGR